MFNINLSTIVLVVFICVLIPILILRALRARELEIIKIRLEKTTNDIRQAILIVENRSTKEEIDEILKRFNRPSPYKKKQI